MTQPPEIPVPPAPRISHPRSRLSLVWIVPVVAALIGLSLLVQSWVSKGPEITISFQSATGLEVGKTTVKYKNVIVGSVAGIALSPDQSHVVVTVKLNKSAKNFAYANTRFWVVRPRIGSSGISGIDTVLSGAYIGVDAGKSVVPCLEFTGLESPPMVINGTPGKSFELHTDDLGSLDIGSPLYYRHIQVGQVASYQLDRNGKGVTLQVFIYAPNDRFINSSTRFWNASGVDISLGADGFKLNTESVATVLAGGIAFSTLDDSKAPTEEHARFTLAKDQQSALAEPDGPPKYLRMRFDQSLRGLVVNAPVEFMGINVGRVESINIEYDPVKQHFQIIVDGIVYPQRLGRLQKIAQIQDADEQLQSAHFISGMVEHGLRAQARSGNLLTGQLYIALDFMPEAPKVAFDVNAQPLIMPTVGGGFEKLQEQVASIVAKADKIPFDAIGRHLDNNLVDLGLTLKQVNGEVLPETQSTLREAQRALGSASEAFSDNSPLQQNIGQTLQELQRTSRSVRTLTDMLSRHPEALIRGRPTDALVPAPTPVKSTQLTSPKTGEPSQ